MYKHPLKKQGVEEVRVVEMRRGEKQCCVKNRGHGSLTGGEDGHFGSPLTSPQSYWND